MDMPLLRISLRLVHCIQKERGSSCAYYADNKTFKKGMLEARTACDVASRLLQQKDGFHLPVASSLSKIRNLIDTHKNPQDSTDDDIMHRIFVCFNTLNSSVVHECILKQVLANSKCKTTIRYRNIRGLSKDINDKLFAKFITGDDSPDVVNHKTEPMTSSPPKPSKRNPRVLSTVESCEFENNNSNDRSSPAPPPPPKPFAPTAKSEDDNDSNGCNSTPTRTWSFQKLTPSSRKVSFGRERPSEPKGPVQQLLDLLHIFVQLKESTGIERAILSSLLALQKYERTLRMLTNDLILEVENQRSLVSQLEYQPDGPHRNLVLDLAQPPKNLKEIQTIILTDFELLKAAEYDSVSIFTMITTYMDKLHSVELFILEELECSFPATLPKSPSLSSMGSFGSLIPPMNIGSLIPPMNSNRPNQEVTGGTSPQEEEANSGAFNHALLEQIFLPSNGLDLASHLESIPAEALKKQLLEVVKADEGDESFSSSDHGVPSTSAAQTLNEDMNRALHKPMQHAASKEWEINLYEIQFTKRIGQGASATTYLATWTGQNVAVKVASITEFGLEGWRTEVGALQRLHHPNIIRLLGSIYHENPLTYCLVLEYCNAGDLATALRYPTPRNFFFHVAISISTAMTYLHSRHVIHRDLKPANVLCDGNIASGKFTVKVTDFGVAAQDFGTEQGGNISDVLDDDGCGVTERNLTGETGTYRWMAPEVIRHETYSSLADVYSFAIMVWQFLTHEEPFLDVSATDAAKMVALEQQRPPLPPKTPRPLADLIKANWSDQPSERWDFEKVSATLKEIQDTLLTPEEKTWLEAPNGYPVYLEDISELEDEIKQKQQQKAVKRQSSKLKTPDANAKRAGSLLSNFFGVNRKNGKK